MMSSCLTTLNVSLLIDNWGQTLNFNCLINRLINIFEAILLSVLDFSVQPIRLNSNQHLLGTYPKVAIGHVVYQQLHAVA